MKPHMWTHRNNGRNLSRAAWRPGLEELENRTVPTTVCATGVSDIFVTGQTLCIVGTAGVDWVSVIQVGDELRVYADSITGGGYEAVPAGSVQLVEMYLGAGSDIASLGVPLPSWIYGGSDNDFLTGGDSDDLIDGGTGDDLIAGGLGNDVIVAGDGNDWVYGDYGFEEGNGNDVIIGGAGADFLHGSGGDDLLLGDSTAFDADEDGLTDIWLEWNSGADYDTRVANLAGGLLSAANHFDDGAYDQMHGQDGQDFFLGYGSDVAYDQAGPGQDFEETYELR